MLAPGPVTSRIAATERGGNEIPGRSHSAAIPWQARIARSETLRAASSNASVSCWAATTGSVLAAQHVFGFAEQHDSPTGVVAETRPASAASTPGSTRFAFAQASNSAGVLQQQFEKHCSAVAQPQGLSMQGNGRERSLPARRFSAAGDRGP